MNIGVLKSSRNRIWSPRLRPLLVVAFTTAVLVSMDLPAATGADQIPASTPGRVALPGQMAPALSQAQLLAIRPAAAGTPMTVTVTLKRSDQAGFDRYLATITRVSRVKRVFLTQEALAARFGPSRQAYSQVGRWLQSQGLRVVSGSINRLTITATGARTTVGAAFGTSIRDYRLGGRIVYANESPPTVPSSISHHIAAVGGISDIGMPLPLDRGAKRAPSIGTGSCPYSGSAACGSAGSGLAMSRNRPPRALAPVFGAFRQEMATSPTLAAATGRLAQTIRGLQGVPLRAQLKRLRSNRDWRLVSGSMRNLLPSHGVRLPARSSEGGPAGSTLLGSQARGSRPAASPNVCITIGSCINWKGSTLCTNPLGGVVQLSNIFALGSIEALLLIFVVMVIFYIALLNAVVLAPYLWALVGVALLACIDIKWYPKQTPKPKKCKKKCRKSPSIGNLARGSAFTEKIGLLEFDTFNRSDVVNWLNLVGLSVPNLDRQLTTKQINGGVPSPGSGESEVLLDIDTGLSLNPTANYTVYEGSANSTFEQMFNTMLNDHDTIISNSWAQCEDQTPPAEAQAIDSVLAQAAASGVAVFNGTGDNGSTCLDGSGNTVAVPADSPHAVAVGGTTPIFGDGLTDKGDRWWGAQPTNPPGGSGGYGVSRYFARPAFQNGHSSGAGRSLPDLSVVADPRAGINLCQADNGGCPSGLLNGGTSMAAPEMAALAGNVEQQVGRRLGLTPGGLYDLANKVPAAFEPASAMKTDFAHVGLGSPEFAPWQLYYSGLKINGVDPDNSGALGSAATAGVASSGILRVSLWSANGYPVGGKQVSVVPAAGTHAVVVDSSNPSSPVDGTVTFHVSDNSVENVAFTVIDSTDHITLTDKPVIAFQAPPATAGSIAATLTSVPADGTSSSTVTVTLVNGKGKPAVLKNVAISEGSGHAIISALGSQPGITNSQGKASYKVVDLTAERVTFTATDTSDGDLPVPGSAAITFTTGSGSDQCPKQTILAARGYKLSAFASGFFDGNLNTIVGCGGVGDGSWDSSGNFWVPDYITGDIYKFDLQGGSPNDANKITKTPLGAYLFGVQFGKQGQLYADQWWTPPGSNTPCGCIYQLDPKTGAIKRVVAVNVTMTTIRVDPISGDIFTSSSYNGGPDYSPDILRIHDPGPGKAPVDCSTLSEASGCTVYSSQGPLDSFAFDRNGTIYGRGCSTCGLNSNTWKVDGTNSRTPGKATLLDNAIPGGSTPVILVPGAKGKLPILAIGYNPSTGYETERLDLNQKPPKLTPLVTGGAGPSNLGPDGCLYVGDSNTLSKLTSDKGFCPYPPASTSGVGLSLNQDQTALPIGQTATFRAHLGGVKAPSGTAIRLLVSGANGSESLSRADANGDATFRLTGIRQGLDAVTAFAVLDKRIVNSTTLFVRWRSGKHRTFVTLNLSPSSGFAGDRATIVASLTDISAPTPTALGGQKMVITARGSQCVTATGRGGLASCRIRLPASPGSMLVRASYQGSRIYLGSSARGEFRILKRVRVGPFPGVWLGYAAGKGRNFPYPWVGNSGVRFFGANVPKGKTWDTAGVRLDNLSGSALHVARVSVYFPGSGKTVQPWTNFAVPSHSMTILASTDRANDGNFDASENQIPGTGCRRAAKTKAPVITITMRGGQRETLKDLGHVLDAGGFPARCKNNESQTWRKPGARGGPFN